MFYSKSVTTSANTTQGAPLVSTVPITSGVLVHSEIYFPPGPSGLVGVQVRIGDIQILPVERTEWIIGDNSTIKIDDLFDVNRPPYVLSIRTYNLDEAYEHFVQVRCTVMGYDAFTAIHSPGIGEDELKVILDDITTKTTQASAEALDSAFEVLKYGG